MIFIVSDNVIQKVKCHFNRVRASQIKANWEKVEEELKFQPPVQLKLEDMELMNGMANGGHAGVHVEVGKLLLHTGDSRLPEPNCKQRRKHAAAVVPFLLRDRYIMGVKPKKKDYLYALVNNIWSVDSSRYAPEPLRTCAGVCFLCLRWAPLRGQLQLDLVFSTLNLLAFEIVVC